jgi:hypothetical protein
VLLHSGCLNKAINEVASNNHLFLTVLETRKSKIKVPAHSVAGEGLFPGITDLAVPSHGGRTDAAL